MNYRKELAKLFVSDVITAEQLEIALGILKCRERDKGVGKAYFTRQLNRILTGKTVNWKHLKWYADGCPIDAEHPK